MEQNQEQKTVLKYGYCTGGSSDTCNTIAVCTTVYNEYLRFMGGMQPTKPISLSGNMKDHRMVLLFVIAN